MKKTVKVEFNQKHRQILLVVALVFFVAKAIQMIVQISSRIAFSGASLYLIDYNFYIGTRTFIGSILTLLTPHITYVQIFILNLAVYIITVALFFIWGIGTAKKAMKENNNFLFFVSILSIVCPYALLEYANWIGVYDIYLCLFAVICCIATRHEKLHWICPVICVMGIFTHYAFAFSFFPAVLCVQAYYILTSQRKASRIASAGIGFAATFSSALYCGFFADSTIKMTRDELYAYMSERLGAEVENRGYFDFYYFQDEVIEMLGDLSQDIINPTFITNFILFFLPVMALFLSIWCYYIIKGKKNQILSGIPFVLTAIVSTALIFLIIEAPRWQAAAIISQFLILFSLVKNNDEKILEFFNKFNRKKINIAMFVFIIYNIIAALIIEPFYG